MKKYTIWSPEFTNFSGGIRALHELNFQLNQKGYQSNLHYENKHDENNIVIYPEIITNNPLNSNHYFQWLLADAKKDGLSFEWVKGLGGDHLLTVNIIDLQIFNPKKNKRKNVGYWIGKGSKNIDLPPNSELINKFQPNNRQDLATQLSSYEYIISFDSFTAINYEATLLGTPVLIANQTHDWSKEKLQKTDWPTYGICWSMDELDEAKKEVGKQYEAYTNSCDKFAKSVDYFIDITQNSQKKSNSQ
jgi:hypothetical protein